MLTIQSIRSSDSERLARFFERNDTDAVRRQFHPFPLTADTARTLACGAGSDAYFAGEDGGEVVAFAMLRGWDEGFETPSFGVLVDAARSRESLGRRMLEHALTHARARGCRGVRLSVYESNTAARKLYESMGFVVVSAEPVVVAGEPDVKVVMHREI
jgi:ribosomal protein S18 acetylase RimI-like enzyme